MAEVGRYDEQCNHITSSDGGNSGYYVKSSGPKNVAVYTCLIWCCCC